MNLTLSDVQNMAGIGCDCELYQCDKIALGRASVTLDSGQKVRFPPVEAP